MQLVSKLISCVVISVFFLQYEVLLKGPFSCILFIIVFIYRNRLPFGKIQLDKHHLAYVAYATIAIGCRLNRVGNNKNLCLK